MQHFTIRPANIDDVETILNFIHQLAEYENLSEEVETSRENILQYGFSERPIFYTLLAEDENGEPVGFALYYLSFSTFVSKPTLYVEDLFVLPESRGQGIGKAFFRELIEIAKKRGYGRVEWSVLDWNDKAINLYNALGAKPVKGWTIYRMDEETIQAFSG